MMNKKILALLAVSAIGISVAGATPQTQFNKGEFQVDLGANHAKDSFRNNDDAKAKWSFDGGVTYALSDKTAVQYNYHGLNHKVDNRSYDADMHEVNLIQSLNKNFAVYGGWARIHHEGFDHANNVAQIGVIGKAPIGSKLEVYGKAGIGTRKTTTWEAGLGYKVTDDLDISAGYRYINTRTDNENYNISYKGPTVGLSYRFGASSKADAEPVYTPAPVETPAPVAEQPATYVAPKLDYYVQSIYFDSDQSVPRADQAPNLQAALDAANQYSQDQVKLMGNADTDANPEYNIGLSERRVQDVAQFLVNHGVSADRLIGIANGDAKPVASNSSSSGKAENRRVDVYIHR